MAEENLDEFLGVKQQPAWRRHAEWGGIALGMLVLLVVAWAWFGKSKGTEYSTVAVEHGRLVKTVSATGKLAPTNQVTVGSQTSGLIVRVLVDVNDRVTAGQVLAEIDPEQIDAQIRQNQAQLAANQAQVGQAQATLAQTQAQLARLEEVSKLSGGRVPSKTEMATARADAQRAVAALMVAKANVVASQATLSGTQTQRARAVIHSPVSGVVLARQVDPGQTVAASFSTPTLFVIAQDLSTMKLEVSIDEADVGSVKEGQGATFTVDAFPGQTFPAKITRVSIGSNQTVQNASSSSSSSSSSTSSSGQVVSYAADLSVANANQQLRPGMTATADIVTADKQNVLLVPNAALRFSPQAQSNTQQQGGITSQLSMRPPRSGTAQRSVTLSRGATQTIYIVGDDGKPKPLQIVTGDSNGSMTEVVSGELRPGMQVITGQLAGENAKKSSGGGGESQRKSAGANGPGGGPGGG